MLNVSFAKRKSGTIKSKQLSGKMAVVLLNAQKRVLKQFEIYVSTWNHKPFFETKGGTHFKGGDISVGVSTDDQVFWWLELGTKIRYAVMTPDFQPKTAPGQIQSQSGQGGFNYLDPMGHQGIEARHIAVEIAFQEESQFRKDVLTVVSDIDFIEGVDDILG